MGTLVDISHELKKTLVDVESRYQNMLGNMSQFDKLVTSYAYERLARKLHILRSWILVQAKALYMQHQDLGYVCVFLREANGFRVLWVESEEIVADKAEYKQRSGVTVLSVEEANGIITDMMDKLTSGNWAEVLDWVKKYAKSPGLDFSKSP